MGQTLLSVPPPLQAYVRSPAGRRRWKPRLASWNGEPVFIGTDPQSRRLGSGGGTVNLLAQAWLEAGTDITLEEWLKKSSRLVLHAGGESRRLPAYSALGKAFLPIPSVPGLGPRRFDQMLADFQVPAYRQVLAEAGARASVLVASGDVWLDFDPLTIAPAQADITGIGMRVTPEVASHFGVFFVAKDSRTGAAASERPIEFFLQKPAPEVIFRHAADYDFYVDTGMWLLSEAAVAFLLRRCGWSVGKQKFVTRDGHPEHLDLYTEIGSALGREAKIPPALRRHGFGGLTSAVIGLDDARFYHLGSSRQLFESIEQMQRGKLTLQRAWAVATPPEAFLAGPSASVWVDALAGTHPVELYGENLAVGLPRGSEVTHLATGWCVEAVPTGRDDYVLRPFQIDDTLRGTPASGAKICGQDAAAWLRARGWSEWPPPAPSVVEGSASASPAGGAKAHLLGHARGRRGDALHLDVFLLPIYPILRAAEITQVLIDWFFSAQPDPEISRRLRDARRVSAAEIPAAIDYGRFFAQRDVLRAQLLRSDFTACLERGDSRVFDQDFAALAEFCAHSAPDLAVWLQAQAPALLRRIARAEHAARLQILLAALAPAGRRRQAALDEGYRRLRDAVVASNPWERSRPSLALKADQIVWARSPVRLDLAGGWSDTPPFCLEHGGAVLNVAVLLNGQPPIQVFVRPLGQAEPLFRLKSIDLGSSEEITTYEGLETFTDPRSGFSLPKAALTLAGFHPQFGVRPAARSLRRQLESFGGGLEISLLSAVPKGSGLGTSSILGATLLGALNRACGLGWDEVDLYQRVLGVEQLLTTGGGWQDQAGALFRGVKLIQTQPGLAQTPAVRYVSSHLLGVDFANHTLLLYYTGVTRLAKGILKEIVHDMFLGRSGTLRTLALIRANADHLHQAMQESDPQALQRCIARSWDLNRRLDPGTTTPEIERILARAGDDLAACKLLGAGGGGYMLLCAKSAEGGRRIREKLEAKPPNRRARFIDFAVSERAVEVTVS